MRGERPASSLPDVVDERLSDDNEHPLTSLGRRRCLARAQGPKQAVAEA
jgi:hypothetical protein